MTVDYLDLWIAQKRSQGKTPVAIHVCPLSEPPLLKSLQERGFKVENLFQAGRTLTYSGVPLVSSEADCLVTTP